MPRSSGWEQWYLPDVARVASDQLDHLARITDGSISEKKKQTGMTAEHGLAQDPREGSQDVGASHVCSDFSDVLTSHCQGVLNKKNKPCVTSLTQKKQIYCKSVIGDTTLSMSLKYSVPRHSFGWLWRGTWMWSQSLQCWTSSQAQGFLKWPPWHPGKETMSRLS